MPNIIQTRGEAFGASNGILTMQDAALGSGIRTIDAAGIATGMAFLEGELEKRDLLHALKRRCRLMYH